ncbi:hypothetical protein U9M48_011529 [Paspalum notatum var. saurae]|uniref:Uncharacterized protein n=1 Tax=Paspalum notatum var. saurae TaxID=547442 RepID=A0AAQ3SWI4_PASNO
MMLGNVTAMKRPGSTSSLQNELAFRPSSAERTLIASLAFPFSVFQHENVLMDGSIFECTHGCRLHHRFEQRKGPFTIPVRST